MAETLARWAVALMRAALLLALVGWVLDVPGRFGRYYYTEQFLALAAGLSAAMVLAHTAGAASALRRWADLGFAAVVLGAFGYVTATYPSLQLDIAFAPPYAVAVALVMVVGVLEAVRRRTGPFLPLLLLVMVAFAFIGPHLPQQYETRPVSFERLTVYLALDTNALLSKVLDIAAVVVAPFVVFGFMLNGFGGAAVFSQGAARLVGGLTGGPAKVSVVGSGAFGMVSGSAVANVVAVGSVSIPMMRRAGYSGPVAAGVEAVASTGGQLAPPIMGAAAFLMAELLELPYRDIALAAILPAILFYAALMMSVDFEARRLKIGGGGKLNLAAGVAAGWRYVIPMLVLIWLLFVEKRTASNAGMLSVAVLVAIHLVWPLRGLPGRIVETVRMLVGSMAGLADIILLAGAAGFIIGVLNITGFSFALTLQMIALSGGALGVLLVITAVLSVVLGLGMPTVGVYILLATLAAPALIEAGVTPIAAHMYVLYFGMLSMITPPIAIASFAAATVAREAPWPVAFASLKVGAGVYLVPVIFVLEPALLMQGSAADVVLAALKAALAVALFTAGVIGHVARPLSWPVRGAAVVLALACAMPGGAAPTALALAAAAAGIALLAWWARGPAPATS